MHDSVETRPMCCRLQYLLHSEDTEQLDLTFSTTVQTADGLYVERPLVWSIDGTTARLTVLRRLRGCRRRSPSHSPIDSCTLSASSTLCSRHQWRTRSTRSAWVSLMWFAIVRLLGVLDSRRYQSRFSRHSRRTSSPCYFTVRQCTHEMRTSVT